MKGKGVSAMRKNYLYLDLGFYQACNLACKYCRKDIIEDGAKFSFDRFKEEINLVANTYKCAVLKMSGYGEITLWRKFPEALRYVSSRFPSIQIITNGTFSEEIFNEMRKYRNLTINFTIDGHTKEMNSLRVENEKLHQIILNNLARAFKVGINVEINCVLHKYNIGHLAEFMQYILDSKGQSNVMLFCFPVKPFDRNPDIWKNVKADYNYYLKEWKELFDKYESILPPYQYMHDLAEFMRLEGRNDKCYVSWSNIGSGACDERLVCPNYGEKETYGDFIKSFSKIDDIEKRESTYINSENNLGGGCKQCFNHYHIINNYLKGDIDINQMIRVPTLSFDGCSEILKKIKEEYDETHNN